MKTLEKIRTDEAFALFWQKAELVRSQHNVSEPEQPRRRKTPRRYEVGETLGNFHDIPESYYKQQYLEALDLIILLKKDLVNLDMQLTSRCKIFSRKQPKVKEYHNELLFVTNFHGADLDKVCLETWKRSFQW